MLDQLIVSGLYTISDLAVLALGLGLAVIIREKDTTSAAPLGVLISAVELAGLLCLILVVVVAALIYPGGA